MDALPELESNIRTALNRHEEDLGPELVVALIDLFLKDGFERISRLRSAFSERDLALFHHEAHTLKGSAANLGATNVVELSAELEALSHSGVLPSDASVLDRLDRETESACRILLQIREGRQAA